MRLSYFFSLATLLFATSGVAQIPLQPLHPDGTVPIFFHCPSQIGVDQQIENRKRSGNPMDEKEERFTREMSYYAQQRTMTGLVLFNDSLSNYVTKVAAVLLKDDTALFHKLHFYVYKDPALNAYTSATGNILVTVGLLAQLENEAQLAFILAHEITHYKKEHMLKGFLNREEMKENQNSSNDWTQSYYTYNQDQELEADRIGFALYKKSPYAISEAKRSFDILEYSDLPFDDVPFDTTYFNKDFMKVPVGYFKKEVDPIYTNDNYEDRSSTHPNVRKRRMSLLSVMDSVAEKGRLHFVVSQNEFMLIREKARYEMCRLLLLQREYPAAIYGSFMLLKKHPNDLKLKKIVGYSLFNLAAYKQGTSGAFPFWGYYWKAGSRYSDLNRSSFYSTPNFEDYPGQQQQVFHLLGKMEADELTVMALSYNWYIYCEDKSDSLQSKLCDSLFSMLVNKQNLYKTYFSTITPSQAQEELRQDSIQKAQETGEVGESKYSRLDKFRITSEKERFIKFAFVELLKDTLFAERFDYYTNNRKSISGSSTTSTYYNETKEERAQRLADEKKYGAGINKVIVVNPDYTYNHEPDRKEDPEQEYPKSETGQMQLCSTVEETAKSEGVNAIVLSPFLMDSLDGDTFSDYAMLNEWFYERMEYGTNNYVTNLANKAEIDSLIARYGTPYLMLTNVEASYLKRVQHPVWFAISCVAIVPIVYAFIPRHKFIYDAVVLDLRTGAVVQMEDKKLKRGKEKEHTSTFFKSFFNKLKRPLKPVESKPVAPAGLRD